MQQSVKVATIQMVSGTELMANLATAERLVLQAAKDGAQLVVLPEYFVLMGQEDTDKVKIAETYGAGVIQSCLANLAKEAKVWIFAGTIPLKGAHAEKIRNSFLVLNPSGEVVTRYDKIHLFGFTKGEESYDESRTIEPGADVVTLETPFGKIGLSICYDIRFPELFRQMGEVDILMVVAAFTKTTGKAHWETILKTRAIENQCFLIASGQGGKHQNGRETFGHSMVIDPWGDVLNIQAEGEGVVMATLEPARLQSVRENLPALKHQVLK
ncbi:carbon-nitrogen hydrolase family protein [Leeia sp. TBRC 13508]|uniref:Carbon-nitrogen hydrolase family protein n=2 Tax=Leeia speluncae TaxID=2884804 RepID=A0ABS8D2J3_9NEIS|nr:carbon-nitrogen hydrolase family protein [Leeia speluncae]